MATREDITRSLRFPRAVLALAVLGSLAVLAAGCGTSKRTQVAVAPQTGVLAFSRCMRAHGVPSFPDPDGSGSLPKSQVAQLAAGAPQFVPAHRTCEHLLPNGGQPSPAQVQQAWNDMRAFARCMRSQGVSDWPDPSFTSNEDHRPFFNTPADIDPTAPRITAKVRACRHVLHERNPLSTTQ